MRRFIILTSSSYSNGGQNSADSRAPLLDGVQLERGDRSSDGGAACGVDRRHATRDELLGAAIELIAPVVSQSFAFRFLHRASTI